LSIFIALGSLRGSAAAAPRGAEVLRLLLMVTCSVAALPSRIHKTSLGLPSGRAGDHFAGSPAVLDRSCRNADDTSPPGCRLGRRRLVESLRHQTPL